MSTTTTNLGLVKPELSDVADITAMNENWDKIDEKLHNAYSDENKPDVTDIGGMPLDGSEKMTGSLKIKDYGEIDASDTLTYLKSKKDINNFRYLRIINPLLTDYTVAKAIQWGNVVNSSEKTYNLHGEHNKTGGSYSGNGSTALRKIETAGMGYGLLIWSIKGWAIVTPSGAICSTGNTTRSTGSTGANFSNGTLTLQTTDEILNASGTGYNYQVL